LLISGAKCAGYTNQGKGRDKAAKAIKQTLSKIIVKGGGGWERECLCGGQPAAGSSKMRVDKKTKGWNDLALGNAITLNSSWSSARMSSSIIL